MRTWIASAISALLMLSPAVSFGATLDLDSWRVTASESDSSQLNLSVEYMGTEQIAPAPASTPTSTLAPASTTAPAVLTIPIVVAPTDTVEATIVPIDISAGDVLINEFVSDPVTGQPEWVELYNTTDHVIPLDDWYLQEGSGKATKLEGWIAPNGYFVASGISGSLNNSGDLIQLYAPNDDWIDGVAYGDWYEASAPSAPDPMSVGRDDHRQFVEMSPTPGTQNRIAIESADDVTATSVTSASTAPSTTSTTSSPSCTGGTCPSPTISNNDYDVSQPTAAAVSQTTTCPEESASGTSATDTAPVARATTIGDVRSHTLGTRLVTDGLVSVIPGILGKQFFYLAGSGIQVYLYSAEFPLLSRGDRVRVEGELRESGGEARIKVDETADIAVLDHSLAPEPHDVSVAQIGEETEAWLVRVSGSVVAAQSSEFTVADRTAEVRVVIQPGTGIATSAHVGDEVTVTGIVSQTKSGYRLLPRDEVDIVVRAAATEDAPDELSALSTQGGDGAGWLLSGMTVLGLTGSAGAYVIRKKLLS